MTTFKESAMDVSMDPFTRQMEACRLQWNQRSLEFILRSARILRAAREAARSDRRWVRWLREEARMGRVTAHRHLCTARYVQENVSLKKHFESLGLTKLYALSRMKPIAVRRFLADERIRTMTDLQFLHFARAYIPKARRRPTIPNLLRCILFGLDRAGRGILRWKGVRAAIPMEHRSLIQLKLREMAAALGHLRVLKGKAL